jgi:hypothetical protein
LLALATTDGSLDKEVRPPQGVRERYTEAKAGLARLRAGYAQELKKTRPDRQGEILDRASGEVLDAITTELLPAWYGTRWSFSGTSTQPGSGSIACGMFVGTVLKDAGFNLDRVAMGRLASEHIALSLTSESNVRRYSDEVARRVERELIARGEGLYLVGLDFHAGLAWVDREGRARFIHSSIWPPGQVASEPLVGDNPFTYSRYRVLARLLDRRMMRRWIRGERFEAIARP